MIKSTGTCTLQKPKHAKRAEAALLFIWLKIAVDRRIAVGEDICKARAQKSSFRITNGHQFCLDDGVLNHGAKIGE